jgi:NAD-dependent DNA ligase
LTSFKTKSEASEALVTAGYRVVDSVTKALSYLVDEANDNSSKRKKAEQYGITIVDNLTQFLKKA